MNKCVIFLPSNKTSFIKLLQIAKSIDVNYPIVFLITNQHAANNAEAIKSCGFDVFYINENLKNNKLQVINEQSDTVSKSVLFNKVKQGIKKLPFIKRIFLQRQTNFAQKYKLEILSEYTKLKLDTEKVFKELSIKLIVVSGDRTLGYNCCILSVAKALSIKVIIPPVSTISGSNEVAKIRFQNRHDTNVTNDDDLMSRYPNQFFNLDSSCSVSFFPIYMLEVLDSLNVLPSSPWVYGESFADQILVEGEFQSNRSINGNVPSEKIEIVGDTELDELYFNLINVEKRKFTGSRGSKLIVIALPQMYEHGLLDLDSQIELVNDLCIGSSKSGAKIIVSLHPKMSLARYEFLQDIQNVVISEEPLREILVAADIFVAINGSSTWLWATMCGIPTILCDWSGLNYDYIDTRELGVTIVRSKKHYPKLIDKLVKDELYFSSEVKKQKNGSKPLALFDGKASKRISDIINGMI